MRIIKRRASLLLAVELAAFAALLCAAVWIRVQSVPQLGGDRLFGTDAFRFFRQAEIILQDGSLPITDMRRWLPTGRDLTVYLSFSSYFLAWLTQFLQIFFPNWTLYQVAVYYPVGAFAAFMIVCYAFARRYLGRSAALISALLLAVAPSAVGRSLAGFSDRDALCLLLGGIVLFGYRLSADDGVKTVWRNGALGASSLAALLLGLTWEGAGLFIAVAAAAEFARILIQGRSKRDTLRFLAWFSFWVVGLLIFTRAYRTEANVSSPFALLAFGPPCFLLACLLIASLSDRHFQTRRLVSFKGAVSVEFGSAAVVLAGGALVFAVFALVSAPVREVALSLRQNAISPLGTSRLMETVGELRDTGLLDWMRLMGALYFLAAVGSAVLLYRLAVQQEWNPWLCVALFEGVMIGALYHQADPLLPFARQASTFLFYASAAALLICFAVYHLLSFRRGVRKPLGLEGTTTLILIAWFLVTLMMTRGANRYGFFLAAPAALLGARGVASIYDRIAHPRRTKLRKAAGWAASAAVMLLVLFIPGMGGYAIQSPALAKSSAPLFHTPDWDGAFAWMRESLAPDAVVAAEWGYGSHLNALGGVRTVVDEDHYIPYWIHLNARHVLCAQDETEALEFLHTRGATHLMLTGYDIQSAVGVSSIGSDEHGDRMFQVFPCAVREEEESLSLLLNYAPNANIVIDESTSYEAGDWAILGFQIALDGGQAGEADVHLQVGGSSRTMPLRRVYVNGRKAELPEPEEDGPTFPGAVALRAAQDGSWRAYYVPEAGYRSLLVQLFLLEKKSRHFKKAYPSDEDASGDVTIWKIEYPPEIAYRKEYLLKDFPNERLKRAWMYGQSAP